MKRSGRRCRALLRPKKVALLALVLFAAVDAFAAQAERTATIDRIKASIVAVGTFARTRSPQFQFLGTGFAVDDGTLIVTNTDVIHAILDPPTMGVLAGL